MLAMEPGGARVLPAADDVWPESEEVAAVDVGLDSQEVTTEDVFKALDSVDPLQSVEGLESVVAQDSVIAQDSVEALLVVPDSVEMVADPVDIVPDSVEMVPEYLPPGAFVCGRCHLVHEDREAWNRAHSRFYPCPRCGLVHADYSIDAMLGHINVDCELFMEHYKGLLPTKDDAKASVR